MKRLISMALAALLTASLAACGGSSNPPQSSEATTSASTASSAAATEPQAEADPVLEGEKPELKILTLYQAYNMEEQPSFQLLEEITGYKVKFFNLPQDNPEQKLLLEISSGVDYDLLMRISQSGYSQLASQNALVDLSPLLDQYGGNIKETVSDIAWASATNDGVIYGIPNESGTASEENPYGMLTGGIGLRSDALEEMGAQLPTTLDEFTQLLRDARETYGTSPLTANKSSQFSPALLSAFGMTDQLFFDLDGVYTHRIKHPNLPEYLAYLQMLYKEKLLDNDMPINTADNAKEKFANKNAVAITPLMFWDIPAMVNALNTNNPDCEIKFTTRLRADESTPAVAALIVGASMYTAIPKTAKNPEHAVNWLNIITEKDNFTRIYVGEEGVSYEIRDGSYYPIFPAFDDYTNADKFTGPWDANYAFQLWQARARKTPEMAKAYEEMNSRVGELSITTSIENYGLTQTVVQQIRPALEQAFADSFLTAIVDGTDPAAAMEKMRADWDAQGGLEVEQAMQAWYDANKNLQ